MDPCSNPVWWALTEDYVVVAVPLVSPRVAAIATRVAAFGPVLVVDVVLPSFDVATAVLFDDAGDPLFRLDNADPLIQCPVIKRLLLAGQPRAVIRMSSVDDRACVPDMIEIQIVGLV